MKKCKLIFLPFLVSIFGITIGPAQASERVEHADTGATFEPYNIKILDQRFQCEYSNVRIETDISGGDLVKIDFNNQEMQAIVTEDDYEDNKYSDQKLCNLEYVVTISPGYRLRNASFSLNGSYVITENGFLLSKIWHDFGAFIVNDSVVFLGRGERRADSFDNQIVDIEEYLDGSCGGTFPISTHIETYAAVTNFDLGANILDLDQAQESFDLWKIQVEECVPNE